MAVFGVDDIQYLDSSSTVWVVKPVTITATNALRSFQYR
jgi:hypothetical protein